MSIVPRGRERAVGWCVLRIIDAGFGELGLHRIFATCKSDNAASEAVMRKLGMRREGLMREKEREGNVWHDHLLYAILELDHAERLNG